MNWRSISLVMLAALVGVLCSLRTSAAEDAEQIERFKINGDGDAILVPVEIKGKSHLFMVDTGCTQTLIDISLLSGDAIGDDRINTPGNDRVVARRYEVPNVRFGNHDLKMTLSSVIGFDFTSFRKYLGHEIMGCIGMDILREFIVEIDFDANELRLSKGPIEVEKSAMPIPIDFSNYQAPRLLGTIDGLGLVDFSLDTGACHLGTGTLQKQACENLLGNRRFRPIGQVISLTMSGECTNQILQGSALTLGGHAVKEPIFTEENGYDSRLGVYFLSRFRVTIDFPKRQLYLCPGRTFDKPDLDNLSGITLSKRNNQVIADFIKPDSTAEKAGIKAEDVILKIDGQDVDQMRLFTLRQRFCQDGNVVKVAIQRGEQPMEVTLELNASQKIEVSQKRPIELLSPK